MIDHTDKKIVEELTNNGRMKMKELGEKVHLTGQAASTRVQKLEDEEIIQGYTIVKNYKKMGYPLHVFLTILTKSIYHQPYLSFLNEKKEYIQKNYKISGEGCYMVEARFPSTEELDEFLIELNTLVNYKLSIVIKET